MATFFISTHAKNRMKERGIPEPSELKLKPAGKKLRKLIREKCKIKGVRNEWGSKYIYFANGSYVFVCVIEDVGKYMVIKAFDVKQEKIKEKAITDGPQSKN